MQNYRHYKNRDYVYYKQNDSDERYSIGMLLDFNKDVFLVHTDIHIHNKEIAVSVSPSNIAPILLNTNMLTALGFEASHKNGSRFFRVRDNVVISAIGHDDYSTELCLVDFALLEEISKFNANFHRYFEKGQVKHDILYNDYKYVGDINRFYEAIGEPERTLVFVSIYFQIGS